MKKREEDQLYISIFLSDQTNKQSKINTQF
jgi:hypothetical protein